MHLALAPKASPLPTRALLLSIIYFLVLFMVQGVRLELTSTKPQILILLPYHLAIPAFLRAMRDLNPESQVKSLLR